MSGLEEIEASVARLEERVKQKQEEYTAYVAKLQQELDDTKSEYERLKQQMVQALQKIDDIIAYMDEEK